MLLMVLFVFILPGLSAAQEDASSGDATTEESAEEEKEPLTGKDLLTWALVAVVISAAIKGAMVKKKFAIPTGWKPVEKVIVGSLAETLVEKIFLACLVLFFTPALGGLLIKLGLAAPTTPGQAALVFLIIYGCLLPYQLVIGTLLNIQLSNLIMNLEEEKIKKLLKFHVLLALVFPVVLLAVMQIWAFPTLILETADLVFSWIF